MDGIPIYVLKALACLQNQISHAHAIARTLATYSFGFAYLNLRDS